MFPPLYAILDASRGDDFVLALADSVAEGGVQLMQLRSKHAGSGGFYRLATLLILRMKERGVRLIINDRPDLAALAGAGGVHVGQEDLEVDDARQICGEGTWVGVSTHNLEQLRAADRTSAEYIAIGPVFPTASKASSDPVLGVDFLREARSFTKKPLVAIGGITIEAARSVFEAGADSVAVIRDLADSPDPGGRAREFLQVAERARMERN